jgi:prevent-host-death family protein
MEDRMQTVNIHEAKTQFSKLIEAVARGEEIVIAKAGKPAARLVPVQPEKPVRKPGALKGKMRIATDFDAPLPDELQAAFEGR